MRYFAQYDENGTLICIGKGVGGDEITEERYNVLAAEIREKADYAKRLYKGELEEDAVPAEWREDVRRRVDKIIERKGAYGEEKIGGDELLAMIEEVL